MTLKFLSNLLKKSFTVFNISSSTYLGGSPASNEIELFKKDVYDLDSKNAYNSREDILVKETFIISDEVDRLVVKKKLGEDHSMVNAFLSFFDTHLSATGSATSITFIGTTNLSIECIEGAVTGVESSRRLKLLLFPSHVSEQKKEFLDFEKSRLAEIVSAKSLSDLLKEDAKKRLRVLGNNLNAIEDYIKNKEKNIGDFKNYIKELERSNSANSLIDDLYVE